jgi:hypothetical protein
LPTEVAVFWNITQCSLVEIYQHFRGTCWLHLFLHPEDEGSRFSLKHLYRPSQIIPWNRVLLEKLIGLWLVKKFLAFYGMKSSISAWNQYNLLKAMHFLINCSPNF